MIHEIKEYLSNNVKIVKDILNYFKYKDITVRGQEIRCSKPDGDNPTSVRIKLNNYMSANDYSLAYKGDIIGLIALHKHMKYGEVINIIKLMINNKLVKQEKKAELFDGFFDEVYVEYKYNLVTYDKSILDKYEKCWNVMFLKDNISVQSQMFFNLGYDKETNRLTIPWFDYEGKLVGVMGRINNNKKTKYKYLPLISFPKHYYLFGLYQNKEYIKKSKEVYLFESEKSVMQSWSYGYKNCVALGGNSIHEQQINQLLKLNVETFILCFDEGLNKEVIRSAILDIRNCLFMKDEVKVKVMFDKDNKYLAEGSKCSPTDLGKETFENMIQECIIGGK